MCCYMHFRVDYCAIFYYFFKKVDSQGLISTKQLLSNQQLKILNSVFFVLIISPIRLAFHYVFQ